MRGEFEEGNQAHQGGMPSVPGGGRRLVDGDVDWPTSALLRPAAQETPVEARSKLDEALELVRGIDGRFIAMMTANLGWVELLDGDLDAACSRFGDGAALALPTRPEGHRHRRDLGLGTCRRRPRRSRPRSAPRRRRIHTRDDRRDIDPTPEDPFASHLDNARAALGDQAWEKSLGRRHRAQPRRRTHTRARPRTTSPPSGARP